MPAMFWKGQGTKDFLPRQDLGKVLLRSVCLCVSVFSAPGIIQVMIEQRPQNREQQQAERTRGAAENELGKKRKKVQHLKGGNLDRVGQILFVD